MALQRGDKTTYSKYTKGAFGTRFNKQGKSAHTVRSRAIQELQNPNTVFILGGEPTYIHSTEAYWLAGLRTAQKEMSKMLSRLVTEQKSKMNNKIAHIDSKWRENLDILGLKTFQEFQHIWEDSYKEYGEKQQSEYFQILSYLEEVRKLHSHLIAVEELKDSNINKLSQRERGKRLIEYGFIDSSDDIVGSGANIRYKDTTRMKQIEKDYRTLLKTIVDSSAFKALAQSTKDAVTKQMKFLKSGIPTHIAASAIGKLQEELEALVFGHSQQDIDKISNAVLNDPGDGSLVKNTLNQLGMTKESLHSYNIAGENYGNKGRLSTGTFKADSFDVLSLDKSISFFSTMKTGEVFNYLKDEYKENPVIRRFTATIESSSMDFSHINQHVKSTVYEADKRKIQLLANYVLRNGAAFGHNAKIQDVRDMLVSYLVWLKLLTEIIGNPDSDEFIPIALKMFTKIYNTADIIRIFLDFDGINILSSGFVNKEHLKDFYSLSFSKNNNKSVFSGHAQELYSVKRAAIYNLLGEGNEANYNNITYSNLYREISSYLKNLAIASQKLPTISTYLQVKVNNIKNIL